ncbi:MAG: hypothetical protein GKR90_06600 [Pseudomonadales bacterium]|nr:hypothetical protein [Pseudomonadales bacterium]
MSNAEAATTIHNLVTHVASIRLQAEILQHNRDLEPGLSEIVRLTDVVQASLSGLMAELSEQPAGQEHSSTSVDSEE